MLCTFPMPQIKILMQLALVNKTRFNRSPSPSETIYQRTGFLQRNVQWINSAIGQSLLSVYDNQIRKTKVQITLNNCSSIKLNSIKQRKFLHDYGAGSHSVTF